MLRALQGVGLSRHRSAIPPADREVAAWFQTPLPREGGRTEAERQLAQWVLGVIPLRPSRQSLMLPPPPIRRVGCTTKHPALPFPFMFPQFQSGNAPYC